MTTGADDKKKLYFLVALLAVAGYFVYTNVLSGPPGVPAPSVTTPAAEAAVPPAETAALPAPAASTVRAPASRNHSEEFHPVYLAKRLEDRPDPMKIDPTLKLELFSKVQQVGAAGGSRNLFLFSQEPPKEVAKLSGAEPVVPLHKVYGPHPPAPPPPPPGPPPPPPITVKFYGFSMASVNGKRLGYFMDGDEILLAGEGDTLERKYRVVHIGPSSAVLEDLTAKREQSVPLTAEGPA
jgi:hypothetical protein